MKKRVLKKRPQMKRLIELRRLLPDPSQAEFASHFKSRTALREFDIALIRRIWIDGEWRPYEQTGWTIELPIQGENLVWSLGVYFDSDDRPRIGTVCTRLPRSTNGWTVVRRTGSPMPLLASAVEKMGVL